MIVERRGLAFATSVCQVLIVAMIAAAATAATLFSAHGASQGTT